MVADGAMSPHKVRLTCHAGAQITVVGQHNTPTIKRYLEESFDYRYSFIGQVVAILLGFTVFFAALAVGASSGQCLLRKAILICCVAALLQLH